MSSIYAYEIQINIFKNDLRNYELWKKQIKTINEQLEELETKRYEVHSTSLIKMGGGTTNPDTKIEQNHNQLDKIEKLNKQKEFYEERIRYVDSMLCLIPDSDYKKALIDVYTKYERYEDVIIKYDLGYSPNGLFKCFERMIIKAFE